MKDDALCDLLMGALATLRGEGKEEEGGSRAGDGTILTPREFGRSRGGNGNIRRR